MITHIGPEKENVDIFTKLPIFMTGLGTLWAMLLLIFGYMIAALKEGL